MKTQLTAAALLAILGSSQAFVPLYSNSEWKAMRMAEEQQNSKETKNIVPDAVLPPPSPEAGAIEPVAKEQQQQQQQQQFMEPISLPDEPEFAEKRAGHWETFRSMGPGGVPSTTPQLEVNPTPLGDLVGNSFYSHGSMPPRQPKGASPEQVQELAMKQRVGAYRSISEVPSGQPPIINPVPLGAHMGNTFFGADSVAAKPYEPVNQEAAQELAVKQRVGAYRSISEVPSGQPPIINPVPLGAHMGNSFFGADSVPAKPYEPVNQEAAQELAVKQRTGAYRSISEVPSGQPPIINPVPLGAHMGNSFFGADSVPAKPYEPVNQEAAQALAVKQRTGAYRSISEVPSGQPPIINPIPLGYSMGNIFYGDSVPKAEPYPQATPGASDYAVKQRSGTYRSISEVPSGQPPIINPVQLGSHMGNTFVQQKKTVVAPVDSPAAPALEAAAELPVVPEAAAQQEQAPADDAAQA